MMYAHRVARKGFSLMEIMIAMAIIAIAGVTVVPYMIKYVKDARISTAKSTLRTLESTVDQFNANIGMYPSKLRDLVKKPRDERIAKKWTGRFFKKEELPEDPWGNAYQYKLTPGVKNPYELYSFGPNGPGSSKEEWISVWDL